MNKSSDSLDKILEILPDLNKKDLKDLKIRIEFLTKEEDDKSANTEDDLLYTAIRNKLYREIGLEIMEYKAWTRTQQAATFKKFKTVKTFLDKFMKDMMGGRPLKRPEKQSGYILYCDIMYEHLKGAPYPVSFKPMLNEYDKFPGLLDKEFPGYVGSGLGALILIPKLMHKDTKGGFKDSEDAYWATEVDPEQYFIRDEHAED